MAKETVLKINDLASKLGNDKSNATLQSQYYATDQQFNFSMVTEKEVQSIIMSMPNEAPGYDKIPARVIKDCLPSVLPAITTLINTSFKTKVFPAQWRYAEVTPIHNNGDRDQPANYRPISLLPILSKVCEKSAHNQLTTHLNNNSRLSTS